MADGRYDYIETGSLVSIHENVKDIVIPSEERHIRLHPMDFEEFLWAMGEEQLMEYIRICFDKKKSMGPLVHRRAMTLFRQYLIIGGMPQVVANYVDTKDFRSADLIKRDILKLYRSDIEKHAKGYEKKVADIFDQIPPQLAKHEKKFILSSLSAGARFRTYESSFLWLQDSMIVNVCYNTREPNTGLKLNRDSSTFKMYMGDTGLLVSHSFDENDIVSEELYKKLLLGKLEVNEGMIFENVVAQMLVAGGHKLYFYSKSSRNDSESRMEIDFLLAKSKVTNRHNISAVEVKSGKNYTISSLKKFRQKFSDRLDQSYVLHTEDLKVTGDIVYLPVYMTGCL